MTPYRLLSTAAVLTLLTGGVALGQSSPSSPQYSSPSSGTSASNPAASKLSQDNVRNDLQKAGFSNIQFVERGYLVQAKAPGGDRVVMALNATSSNPASSGASGVTSSGASGSASSGTSIGTPAGTLDSNLHQKLEQSGFEDIQIVPAGYVIQATSPEGEQLAITISPLSPSSGGSSGTR